MESAPLEIEETVPLENITENVESRIAGVEIPNVALLQLCERADNKTLGNLAKIYKKSYTVCSDIIRKRKYENFKSVNNLPFRGRAYYGKEGKLLGQGSFGRVYITNKKFAVKHSTAPRHKGIHYSTIREIVYMQKLCCNPNIHRLIDVDTAFVDQSTDVYQISEVAAGDLKKFVNSKLGLNNDQIKDILYQLAFGMAEIVSCNIVHRDIKPQNVLVFNDPNNTITGIRCKISDFGLAQNNIYSYGVPFTGGQFTLWYRAPEVLIREKYSFPADIWALACTFAEVITGKPLFPGKFEEMRADFNQLETVFKTTGAPDVNDWPEYFDSLEYRENPEMESLDSLKPNWTPIFSDPELDDLLKKMLILNPEDRITIFQLLTHPYFAKYNPDMSRFDIKSDDRLYDNMVYPISTNVSLELRNKVLKNYVPVILEKIGDYPAFGLSIAIFDLYTTGELDLDEWSLDNIYRTCYVIASKLINGHGGKKLEYAIGYEANILKKLSFKIYTITAIDLIFYHQFDEEDQMIETLENAVDLILEDDTSFKYSQKEIALATLTYTSRKYGIPLDVDLIDINQNVDTLIGRLIMI